VADYLEGRLAEQWFDVAARTCEIVIDAENLALLLEQSCAQMRAQKARTTRHKNPLFHRTPPGCYRDKTSCRADLPRNCDRQNEERELLIGGATERGPGNAEYPRIPTGGYS